MKLPVVFEIEQEMDSVTPEEMDKARRSLGEIKDGEQAIGRVNDPNLQKLWSLAHRMMSNSMLKAMNATMQASCDEEAKEWRLEAERLSKICELCRDVFWYEARAQVGDVAWSDSIGLRGDFVLVKTNAENQGGIPPALRGLLGLK